PWIVADGHRADVARSQEPAFVTTSVSGKLVLLVVKDSRRKCRRRIGPHTLWQLSIADITHAHGIQPIPQERSRKRLVRVHEHQTPMDLTVHIHGSRFPAPHAAHRPGYRALGCDVIHASKHLHRYLTALPEVTYTRPEYPSHLAVQILDHLWTPSRLVCQGRRYSQVMNPLRQEVVDRVAQVRDCRGDEREGDRKPFREERG